jgi:hypothetical protein
LWGKTAATDGRRRSAFGRKEAGRATPWRKEENEGEEAEEEEKEAGMRQRRERREMKLGRLRRLRRERANGCSCRHLPGKVSR